jgi:DNA-binding response OmpR family regulator
MTSPELERAPFHRRDYRGKHLACNAFGKPFHYEELVARLRAVLRRRAQRHQGRRGRRLMRQGCTCDPEVEVETAQPPQEIL